jgi:hypothetical protein
VRKTPASSPRPQIPAVGPMPQGKGLVVETVRLELPCQAIMPGR